MPKDKSDIEQCRNILKDEFRKISPAGEEELNEMTSLFNLESFPRKSIIISPETENIRLFYIIEGLVRNYYITDGKEINADFIEENKLFTSTYSILAGAKNIDYFEAQEDTVCLVADLNKLEALFHKYHSLERLARKIVEKYYSQSLIEMHNKLFLSSEERFDIFMKERSALLNRVSLKNIASYLSIVPETLSRLRSKR